MGVKEGEGGGGGVGVFVGDVEWDGMVGVLRMVG